MALEPFFSGRVPFQIRCTRNATSFRLCGYVSVIGQYLFFLLSLIATLLQKLHKDLKRTRRAAYAEGTHKNHRTQWKAYLYFCFYFGLQHLSASLETVCLYCQFLTRSMTPQSVHNYLSSVKLLHVLTSFDFPFYEAPELKLTLHGLDRIIKHAPSRAPPVTPELLRESLKCAQFTSLRDLFFSCAFLLPFFCLHVLISNLAPASVGSFDPKKTSLSTTGGCCGK